MMQSLIKKIISDFIGGIVFSLIVFLFFIWIEAGYSFKNVDGHHAVFYGLVTLPIGSIVGIFLIEKLFLKFQGFNIIGLIIGSALSCCLGGIISMVILKNCCFEGVAFSLIFPLIYTFISIAGFHYKKTIILLSKIFLKSDVPL